MKTDKKSLLEFAEQNGWRYPKASIVIEFAIGGGAIGGFIVGVIICTIAAFVYLFEINKELNLSTTDLILMLFYPFLAAMIGIIVGFVPALLMGLWASYKKMIIVDKKDYLHLFTAGMLVSIISYMAAAMFNATQMIVPSFGLALIGGLSAMICGKLFLPKLPKNF